MKPDEANEKETQPQGTENAPAAPANENQGQTTPNQEPAPVTEPDGNEGNQPESVPNQDGNEPSQDEPQAIFGNEESSEGEEPEATEPKPLTQEDIKNVVANVVEEKTKPIIDNDEKQKRSNEITRQIQELSKEAHQVQKDMADVEEDSPAYKILKKEQDRLVSQFQDLQEQEKKIWDSSDTNSTGTNQEQNRNSTQDPNAPAGNEDDRYENVNGVMVDRTLITPQAEKNYDSHMKVQKWIGQPGFERETLAHNQIVGELVAAGFKPEQPTFFPAVLDELKARFPDRVKGNSRQVGNVTVNEPTFGDGTGEGGNVPPGSGTGQATSTGQVGYGIIPQSARDSAALAHGRGKWENVPKSHKDKMAKFYKRKAEKQAKKAQK